jgi:hypothetical protein
MAATTSATIREDTMLKSALLSSAAQIDAVPVDDVSNIQRPALYSIPDARRRAGGIGNTLAYELIAQGKWVAVKLGARTLITAASLDAFIGSLPSADIRMTRKAAA